MKRYAYAFALFGFFASIVVALATDMTVGQAIGRGVLFAFAFALLGASLARVVNMQLDELKIEEEEQAALEGAQTASPDGVYGRFNAMFEAEEAEKTAAHDAAETVDDAEAEPAGTESAEGDADASESNDGAASTTEDAPEELDDDDVAENFLAVAKKIMEKTQVSAEGITEEPEATPVESAGIAEKEIDGVGDEREVTPAAAS